MNPEMNLDEFSPCDAARIAGWLATEKLDGIRALWTGERFLSRNGNPLPVPPAFAAGLPSWPVEGELWGGRGRFERVLSAVEGGDWSGIRFVIFDAPGSPGSLLERRSRIAEHLAVAHPVHAELIAAMTIESFAAAEALYQAVLGGGGEGLVLRDPAADYATPEADLKWKPIADADAIVIEHHEQKASVRVRDADGREWWLAIRGPRPFVGSRIVYRFQGYTARGVPRHTVYLRERIDCGR